MGKPLLELMLPTVVYLPRKTIKDKVWYVNLNNYRGCHPHILSETKELYHEEVRKVLAEIPGILYDPRYDGALAHPWLITPIGSPFRPVIMEYTLLIHNAIRRDTMNVVSIVSKYAEDALVQFGVLTDDDITTVRGHVCRAMRVVMPKGKRNLPSLVHLRIWDVNTWGNGVLI